MSNQSELINKHINEKPPLIKGLPSLDIKGLASYIKNGYAKKILILTGAGISVKSGIPDFRSPGTGLYDNFKNYGHESGLFKEMEQVRLAKVLRLVCDKKSKQ